MMTTAQIYTIKEQGTCLFHALHFLSPLSGTIHQQTETAVPVWAVSLPLPAVIMISVGLYLIFLATVLWCHHCLKAKCDPRCSDCCASFSPCEYCLVCAQSCDCRPTSLRSCLDYSCPSPNCAMWDCACTCQPPECDSINCFCFEIKFK